VDLNKRRVAAVQEEDEFTRQLMDLIVLGASKYEDAQILAALIRATIMFGAITEASGLSLLQHMAADIDACWDDDWNDQPQFAEWFKRGVPEQLVQDFQGFVFAGDE